MQFSACFSLTLLFLVHYGNAVVYTDGQISVEWLINTREPGNKDTKCYVYEEGKLGSNPDEGIIETDTVSISNMVDECMQSQDLSLPRHHKAQKRSLVNILDGIYPGTLWCGRGNIADNETNIGYWNLTDTCCKEHDNCDVYILEGQTKYRIHNDQPYTMCSCECDERFRQCLDEVGSFTSKAVGSLFFNVVQIHCIQREPVYSQGRLIEIKGKLIPPRHYGLLPKKQVTFDQVVAGNSSVFSWLGGFFGK